MMPQMGFQCAACDHGSGCVGVAFEKLGGLIEQIAFRFDADGVNEGAKSILSDQIAGAVKSSDELVASFANELRPGMTMDSSPSRPHGVGLRKNGRKRGFCLCDPFLRKRVVVTATAVSARLMRQFMSLPFEFVVPHNSVFSLHRKNPRTSYNGLIVICTQTQPLCLSLKGKAKGYKQKRPKLGARGVWCYNRFGCWPTGYNWV